MTSDASDPRTILSLDTAGWRWSVGRHAPDATAPETPVTLPHCWNADEEWIVGRLPRRGWATYRLDVVVPSWLPDRVVRWRCGGFRGVGHAWVNGCRVGRFNADYLGFDLDVSAALQPGTNRFVVQTSNRHARAILPGITNPDFHLYGGLGGDMHLAFLPPVRLCRDECRVTADDECTGAVRFDLGLFNSAAEQATATAHIVVRDPEGRSAAEAAPVEVVLAPGMPTRCEVHCAIAEPRRWSPSTPVLYSVEATLRRGAETLDRLTWTFGLRSARFVREQGFVLNGQPLVLRGVNRHENLPGFGFALPRALHAEDARLIKKLGFNFVRLSHYPQSPEFLDACDRLGLLVYAELCSWKSVAGGRWLRAAETQLARMIRRDRHHPSIVVWGLGNEGRHRGAYLRLRALTRELDPSRPTIYAENHAYRARRKKTAGLTDVWGLNYEFDELDFARSAVPTGCVVVSECANLPYARRGHYAAEAQQVVLMRDAVRRAESAGPGVAGWTLWCFADYATPRRQRWFRECGVVDGWRGGKLAADWAQACWGPEPFLSVRGDWSFDGGARRHLYLATNCTDIQVIRAADAEETISVPAPGVVEYDAIFDGAPIRFVGRRGTAVVEARLKPWDVPAAFALRSAEIDPGLFRCALQVADARGTPVLGYEGEARVTLPPGARGSLIGGSRLPVHAGQAAFVVETSGAAVDDSVACALDDFPLQTISLAGGGRSS